MTEDPSKNNFNKLLLLSHIITRCDRRLFLDLSKNKPNLWLNPVRKPEKSKRIPIPSDMLKKLGKDYEQNVYSQLRKLKETIFKEVNGNVGKLRLSVSEFANLYKLLEGDPTRNIVLLEFEYHIPEFFFQNLFPHKDNINEIPVDYGNQRPDIIIIGNTINKYKEDVFELLPNGNFRIIPKDEVDKRFGISIFDIKKTQEEKVGKKHFVEIFYYMWTLAVFLKVNKLDKYFYIRANYNGIFPEHEQDKLNLITKLEDVLDLDFLTIISWEEARRIFLRLFNKIRNLWNRSPCSIESILLNIHQGCGYCRYIEDCKNSLGCTGYSDPATWSLRLIPFTSPSIAEQLINDYGFTTIDDVFQNINNITVGIIPKPLYPELPLLKLKAEALIEERLIYPRFNETHSYNIPQYSPIALNFGVEYDTNNDRVFVVGIYLRMFVSKVIRYHNRFYNWWKTWKDVMQNPRSFDDISVELNEHLLPEITEDSAKRFFTLLTSLKGIEINLKDEKTDAGTEIIYKYSQINKDLSKESEAELAKNMILQLYTVIEVSSIIEDYIITEGYQEGTYYGPNTSLLYWGETQLKNFEKMIERNLDDIIDDSEIRVYYQNILLYFRPSDTEVANPYQHKKLFDVQKFAESYVGVPDIINYTWHGIAHKLFNLNFSLKHWIPHFNFLDLNNWLSYLSPDLSGEEKQKMGDEIERQQIIKLKMIDNIRYKFQREGNIAISKNARPINRTKYRSATLPSDYHAIAHVWYIFSLRTSALQIREAEHFRTMFPEFSIGKMAAAKVSDLSTTSYGSEKGISYHLSIKGLSSNMKIKENDLVLLIPNIKRDLNPNFELYNWIIQIKSITWDSDIKGNRITTEVTQKDVFENCRQEKIPSQKEWYLYPTKFDAWSNKLNNARNTGLFQRENFGASWLGHRLSYLWKIRTDPELFWPSEWNFTTPAIYLFAPDLLRNHVSRTSYTELLTTIHPYPDPSQEEAIKTSLSQIISAILGPPGTGKSQTIAALIDEYVCRRKHEKREKTRILVTSFSYAALRVVLEKIREKSRDRNKNPTLSSQIQMVFLRSESRSPIPQKEGCRDVDDLMRRSNGAWRFNDQKKVVTKTKLLEEQLEDNFIIFANAHQLYRLPERVKEDFAFDLICVDEASQLPVDHFMSSLQFIHKQTLKIANHSNGLSGLKIKDIKRINNLNLDSENNLDSLTKVVIVGDHNQLPPVMPISPPKKLESVLSSLFSYYVSNHKIPSEQLQINYRSHRDIVEFTSGLELYHNLRAHENNANRILSGDINNIDQSWLKYILSPEKVICSLIHDTKFEIGISPIEAELVAHIIKGYYLMISPRNKSEEIDFWTRKVGVVSPHNAQGSAIIQKVLQSLESLTHLDKAVLMNYLKNTVYSVEKFQGSDRDLIITSIGLSDIDKISNECEFIFDLSRFNVLTSRAKSKLIFISSREFLNYIPDESKLIENTSKFNYYVNKFCNKHTILNIEDEDKKVIQVEFRYKQ